jgi:hypothetical protein
VVEALQIGGADVQSAADFVIEPGQLCAHVSQRGLDRLAQSPPLPAPAIGTPVTHHVRLVI